MPTVRAKVTPAVLVWARETAGLSQEQVARKISKTFHAERLKQWEENEAQPTIKQLRRLSQIYKSTGFFYLPRAPRDFPVPHDFRRLPDVGPPVYSPELRFELRAAQERRRIAILLYDDLEEAVPGFALAGNRDESPESLARRAREALGVTLDQQVQWRGDQYKALREWKKAVEALGVLVFQVSEITSQEMRGFSIYQQVLPIMAVNRSERPRARIFSMMHELTHLMLKTSGVCDFDEDAPGRPLPDQQLEVLCNRVAAEILVPKSDLLVQPQVAIHPRPRDWGDQEIGDLSRRYAVSREVIVRSLLTHGRTSEVFYLRKREQYRREYKEWRDNQEGGYENHGEKRLRILGNTFARLVLDTYANGRLTLSEVAGYLGVKVNYVPTIEQALGGT
jgi:Zn-dependent peptidase ImmA (M78 family)/transcriptional regulator with XRE-family HTH domain